MEILHSIYQGVIEGFLAEEILKERGLDRENLVVMYEILMNDTPISQEVFDQIWMPAVNEARRKLAQQPEGGLGPEKH